MNYIKVRWIHDDQNEPILLYSELDSDRWEVRKVEIFADGRIGHAGERGSVGDSGLSETPIPVLEKIALDPQFQPVEITKEEFEKVWIKRDSKGSISN